MFWDNTLNDSPLYAIVNTLSAYKILATGIIILGFLLAFKTVQVVYREWTSPLNDLQGPPKTSLLFGNLRDKWDDVRENTLHQFWDSYIHPRKH